jgi:endoglucanase
MRPSPRTRRRIARGATVAALATIVAGPWVAPVASAAPPAVSYVRVNQVGYVAASHEKRAWLLSTADLSGSSFEVRSGGSTVLTEGVGADLGPWNDTFTHLYPLDVGNLSAPGTYTIVASGATSPPFRVDTAAALYAPLIHNGVDFFRAHRDGAKVDPSLLDRQPSHLNDASASVYAKPHYDADDVLLKDLVRVGGPVNVEGGWFDAGDYIKLVATTTFADSLMLVGLRDDASVAGPARMRAEAKHGLTWLLKMWDDRRRVLYTQVGIGSGNDRIWGDHDVWRLPQDDDHYTARRVRYLAHRPVFRAGPPGAKIAPSLAGRFAAVMGLCGQVFAGTQLGDRCLTQGQHVLAQAKTHLRGRQTTTQPWDYYAEDSWLDDLEYGAVELYLGLSAPGAPAPVTPGRTPRFYLALASRFADRYVRSPYDGEDTFNLYDVSALAHEELYAAIGPSGGAGLPIGRLGLLQDLRAQLDPAAHGAATHRFGSGGSLSDPAPHAFGLAIVGTRYDRMTGSSRYADMVQSELAWALGDNAWGTTFVVGAGSVFPRCMQDQISNLSGSNTDDPPLLVGATVDGPSDYIPTGFFGGVPPCRHAGFTQFDRPPSQRYVDRLSSWATVEPALDYSSLSLLAFTEQAG